MEEPPTQLLSNSKMNPDNFTFLNTPHNTTQLNKKRVFSFDSLLHELSSPSALPSFFEAEEQLPTQSIGKSAVALRRVQRSERGKACIPSNLDTPPRRRRYRVGKEGEGGAGHCTPYCAFSACAFFS